MPDFPDNASHPLGPPTAAGTLITVDVMLNQPTRITKFLMDLTQEQFLMDDIFNSDGGVTGGAVIFDQITENQLYLDRDVQMVPPGGQFPLVTGHRLAPGVAVVEKWGGKYFVEDEAKDRNDLSLMRNRNVQLGNTMVRKLNQRAIFFLENAITAVGGATTVVGHDWSAAVPAGAAPTVPSGQPHADIAGLNLLTAQQELAVNLNTLLVNPTQLNRLTLFYGQYLQQVLTALGITKLRQSNRVPIGTAYVLQSGEVGGFRVEKPLGTESWRDPDEEKTWVQSSWRGLFYVTNPFAVFKLTGLGA